MGQGALDLIIGVMRDLFDEYAGPISRTTTARDIPQWDSLAHVQLIVLVEQAAKIRFTTREIAGFANVGELADLTDLKRNGG